MKMNDKYILEITIGEASRLFHYIPEKDPVTRKIKDTLGKIISDNTPCTLLSTNPLDQMSTYPVPDPDKE